MLKIVVFTLSLLLIVFTIDQDALGDNDDTNQEEYLDFQPYTGNRMIVFNDTRIDYCVTNNNENPGFNHIAANAVNIWHERIVDVTHNPFVWDMTTHIQPKNQSICDGFINYVDTPDPTIFQVSGVVGFSHPLTPVANVTIYTDDYQSTLKEMSDKNKDFWDTMTLEKFQDIVKNGDHKQFDYETIKRITLHELGHSLSLNHPVTSDGNLRSATGIMGYNMSYNQIDENEVINIVKAYPNGLTKVSLPKSINLNDPISKKIVHLGEVTNLTIELPNLEEKLPPIGFELYIFPEGTTSQKPDLAPIKIIKTEGRNQIENDEQYLSDIHVSMIHWDTFTKVLSIQFKVLNEFENADIIIVSHSLGGFEKQWFLEDVMTVDQALFSDILLDIETTEYTYHLMGKNPNREIEKESAFELKQKTMYNEALGECLVTKNMKKCADEIKLDDFEVHSESVSLWMP